ncbi:MAG: TonB-dependent receptor family protein [Chitinophagaceae bacterium]|nr:TonB-dependent receptor family protein [Chitinophagaceae bacterium]
MFFTIAILFIGLQLFAQNTKVNGTVLDSATQKSLYPATITLINSKGQTVKTFNNNNDGSFDANVNEGDTLFLVFNFVNYFEKKIQLSKDKSKLNLGNILLSPIPASLTEIIVKGKKPPVGFKVDRQVFKAAQFSNASAGNGVDVLKNLPSVSVNGQGEISFRGSNNFLVLVNGKVSQGDPAFVLSQLSAASIENIEVITSPTAAYDADGKSGIINIVTKTGADNGWMIQSNGMLGTPPFNNFENKRNPQRYSSDFSAAFRNNKWDISGGLNYLRNDIAGFREGDVYTIFNNIKTSLPSNGERSFYRYNYGGRIAALYTIDKKNTIGGGFYSGKKFQSRVADLFYSNSKTNQLFGVTTNFNYYNANDQQKSGIFSLGNLEYIHQFSKDSKLSVAALYEKANLSGTTTNNNLKGFGSKDTIQYTVNPNTNPLNAYRLKSDFTQKLGAGNLQLGYQFRYDTQLGNFLYLTKNLGTNTFATDPLFTSTVAVYNRIHGVYVQYGATQKKLTYNGGLRLEHSNRDLYFSKNSEEKHQSLTNLFPAFQLRYAAWNKGIVKLGYNRRIKRTNNFELNPLPEREHSETLEQGDPNLLPELTGTFETGIEQTFNKGSFFATIYAQNILNPIQRVNRPYNDSILIRAFTNAGKANQIGLETNFTYQATKWWTSIIGGNVYKYSIKGNIFNGVIAVDNNSWVYSINSTQTFSLPQSWTMQFSVNYLSLRATAQGEDGRFITPNLAIKKTSADKRWNVQLLWLNMDGGLKISNIQRITTRGSNFYTTTNYIYEPDQLQLSVGFNLSKKNRKINLPVSEIGEKEF